MTDLSGSPRIPLKAGDRFGHGRYLEIDVLELSDGVYPFIRTGRASQILPWRKTRKGFEICLLKQTRADTDGSSIVKVCGGYNHLDKNEGDTASDYLAKKLGMKIGMHQIIWWRKCKGCGPQYDINILFGFLQEPEEIGSPTSAGCSSLWMGIKEAMHMMTARKSELFDDFALAHLAIFMMRYRE